MKRKQTEPFKPWARSSEVEPKTFNLQDRVQLPTRLLNRR